MTSDEWVPFGYDEADRDQYLVLLEGVSEFLRAPLVEWAALHLAGGGFVDMRKAHELQSLTRVRLGLGGQSTAYHASNAFRSLTDSELLRAIDGMLALRMVSSTDAFGTLERIFEVNKSKWMVGDRLGKLGLVERVPEGVQTFVESVIRGPGAAGQLLATAWANVHGLEKNPSEAYRDCVRAVEAVAIPLVSPTHSKATLGSVISQMRDQGDWSLPFQRGPEDVPSGEVLRALMRTLWEGHRDRHSGQPDFSSVTEEEARAAVGVAATLVDWFASKAVARR